MLGRMQLVWGNPNFWWAAALIIVISNGYIAVMKITKRYFAPQYRDTIHELQILVPEGAVHDQLSNKYVCVCACVCVPVCMCVCAHGCL